MAISTNKNKKGLFTEINITPLTDIFLVLLIIMMVVAPSFQSNNSSVEMPEIKTGAVVEYQNATVAITKDGTFFVNGNQTSPDSLASDLTALKANIEKKEVIVKADKATKSREIMKVMRAAQEAEYEKFIIAGEQLSEASQKELHQGVSVPSDDE